MRKRILIVDDNTSNLRLFELLLRSQYAVETVTSAEDALSAIHRRCPDLILMDVQLPGMDGITLTRRLREDVALGSVPIVALTAYAMVEDRDRALAAGCIGFISKPIDTRTFTATIEEHLAKAS